MAARNRLAMTFSRWIATPKPPPCSKTSGRAAPTPPDFWFRLGEIYERRLNDPAKAQESVREGAAGIAAL